MKLKSGRVRAVAVGLICLMSAAACSSGGGTPASGATASAWAMSAEPIFKESFEAWNAANANQKFDVQYFANDAYKEKVRVAVGAGQAPTLIYNWTGGTLSDYVKAGAVLDLTDDLGAAVEGFLPAVAASGQVDGRTYAVPNNVAKPVLMYYNKDLFEQVGAEPPETWDDVMALVETFTAAGITPFALAGQSRWPELMWIQYLTDRIGGPEVFQAVVDQEPGAWSDPAIIEATTKIQELVDAQAFGPGFASIAADSQADLALVHTGQAAMVLHLATAYANIKSAAPEFVADGKLGFTTFPSIPGGRGDPANLVGNPSNFWSVSSTATAEQKQAAVDYLVTELTSERYVDSLIATGGVPTVAGIESKLGQSANAEHLTFVYSLIQDAPHLQLSWDQALPSDQAQELLVNLERIFLGQVTPEDFASNMNATLVS